MTYMSELETLETEEDLQIGRAIRLLGANLARARKRRGETQEMFAKRIGVTRQTVAAMEAGLGTVSIANFAKALNVIGMAMDLGDVGHPDRDVQGRVAEAESLPTRVRPERALEEMNF